MCVRGNQVRGEREERREERKRECKNQNKRTREREKIIFCFVLI